MQRYKDAEIQIVYRPFHKGSRKKKVPPLMGRPLRGGWVKAAPLRKKELFLKFFFILLPLKNINYFTLDNLSKYGHIMLKFVGIITCLQ